MRTHAQVVLMEDWLHLSGPLLCTQLGAPWCDTQLWQRLAAAAPDPARPPPAAAGGAAASPSCGVRGTLPIGRESWGDDLYRALQARNRRDMRLYAAARGRARSLLERAGVVVPPDVGPALEWGMASGDCARLDGGGGWGAGVQRADVHFLYSPDSQNSASSTCSLSGAMTASR